MIKLFTALGIGTAMAVITSLIGALIGFDLKVPAGMLTMMLLYEFGILEVRKK